MVDHIVHVALASAEFIENVGQSLPQYRFRPYISWVRDLCQPVVAFIEYFAGAFYLHALEQLFLSIRIYLLAHLSTVCVHHCEVGSILIAWNWPLLFLRKMFRRLLAKLSSSKLHIASLIRSGFMCLIELYSVAWVHFCFGHLLLHHPVPK